MLKIEQYDEVELVDGRRGCVVEVARGPGVLYAVDVGSSPEDWETLYLYDRDIARVVARPNS